MSFRLTSAIFISIHALREEGDRRPRRSNRPDTHFYPRPPRGGRLAGISRALDIVKISIHALREEGDQTGNCSNAGDSRFLSTPSARRATDGDSTSKSTGTYFYPRPPRGGRRYKHYGT